MFDRIGSTLSDEDMVHVICQCRMAAVVSIVLSLTSADGLLPRAAMKGSQPRDTCEYWQAKVDPSMRSTPVPEEAAPATDRETLAGMRCLLTLEGRTSPSTYESATVGYELSQRFDAPSVEVAALFYVSYLFYERWQHSRAMILIDRQGNRNSKKSIARAYIAYRAWLAKISEGELDRARKEAVDPLYGTGLHWY